jgi:hypothetical protein
VVGELHVRSQTRDASTVHRSCRELVCGVAGVGAVRGGSGLPAVAGRVEGHGVQVDLLTGSVAQDQPGRQVVLGDLEAVRLQCCREPAQVGQPDDEVDVVVLSVLGAEECVHTPAAVQPDLDAGRRQGVQQLQEAR